MTGLTRKYRRWVAILVGAACTIATGATAADAISIQHEGQQRAYVAHLPKSYDGSKVVPLVIALHGTTMTGDDMLKYTDLARKSDEVGFLLVAPNSLGKAFNDGTGRGGSAVTSVNDVGFVESVADDLKKRFKVDTTKIYLVGLSSGAAMVQRIAAESKYEFAAFASVSDHLWVKASRVSRPRPLLLIFGTADPLNPIEGATVSLPVRLEKPAHATTARAWADRLRCEATPSSTTLPGGVSAKLWRTCEPGARVAWYEIESLAHHWSGGAPLPFPERAIGKFTSSPSLGDLIWEFLAAAP